MTSCTCSISIRHTNEVGHVYIDVAVPRKKRAAHTRHIHIWPSYVPGKLTAKQSPSPAELLLETSFVYVRSKP